MLPPIRQLTTDSAGVGFFVCTRRDLRPGRNGEFLSLMLQNATGDGEFTGYHKRLDRVFWKGPPEG